MKLSSKRLKTLVLPLVMIVCTVGNTRAADDALMKMLPDDCSFCVRINDLSGSLAKMDQYLTGAAPIGAAMLVNTQLAGIVGDPTLTGIEMNGTFLVIGLSDMTVGLLVPVTNYAEFVKNNPNCNQTEGRIALLTSPNSPMGAFAMVQITSKYALVVPESEKASLVNLKAALTKVSSPLSGKLTEAQVKEAATAPVWAYVNLASLYDQFSPMILAQMEKAEQEMPAEMTSSMGDMITFYLKVYKEMLKQIAGEADSATITLTPEMANLTIDTSLRAKEGSELAQMLVADPKADDTFKFTGYLDNDNAVNGLMKIDPPSMTKMYDKMFDILEKSKDSPELAEQVTKLKALTHKMLTAMGDEIAFSFSYAAGKPPFKLREVIAVKDMDAMKQLTKDFMEFTGDFYAAMGMPMDFEYETGMATYKNATIDKMVLTFPPSDDPNDPMQAVIEQMYGGDLVYTIAQSADTYYVAMGEDSEADIKALIDQDASASPTGETKAAIDLLQKTPYNEFVCSVNVIKLMTGLGGLMQNMGPMMQNCGDGEPTPMPDIFGGLNIPSQSSLAIGGQIADGQLGMRTVLPKQHLMEIFGAVMQIQQKMMPQQMPQPSQQSTPAPATLN
ncbi:hypothetical protein ACFL1G_09095 [Planctomycetota bacterium]